MNQNTNTNPNPLSNPDVLRVALAHAREILALLETSPEDAPAVGHLDRLLGFVTDHLPPCGTRSFAPAPARELRIPNRRTRQIPAL